MRNRIVAFLLLCVLCFSFVACSREYTEEEVFPVARELVEKSRVFNDIYFGYGIPVKEGGKTSGVFAEADMEVLADMGFTSIEDIKAQTKEVFSTSMCNWLFERFSAETNGAFITLARYYELDGVIMVNTEYDVFAPDAVTYDYSTMKLDLQNRGQVKITMEATATRAEGLFRTMTIDITLIETGDGFRLDSPTYLVYSEN